MNPLKIPSLILNIYPIILVTFGRSFGSPLLQVSLRDMIRNMVTAAALFHPDIQPDRQASENTLVCVYPFIQRV